MRDKGWVEAEKLVAGDEVFTSRGGWLKVAGGTWLQGTRTVYNLEVNGFHTYFVGESEAWVHNVCKVRPHPDAMGPHTVFKYSDETGRVSGYTTFKRNPHTGDFVPVKRFRGEGRPHGRMKPEFILEPKAGKGIGSPPKVPRKPEPWELPRGY